MLFATLFLQIYKLTWFKVHWPLFHPAQYTPLPYLQPLYHLWANLADSTQHFGVSLTQANSAAMALKCNCLRQFAGSEWVQ